MKTYVVYLRGVEIPTRIKAGGHNAAEKKAQKKYGPNGFKPHEISVAYTEE